MYDRQLSTKSKKFQELKELILGNELLILQKLGFNLKIDHPYPYLIEYLQKLNAMSDGKFAQFSWNYVNDSWIRTTMCLTYEPQIVAAAAIYVASRVLERPLDVDNWYEMFNIEFDRVKEASAVMSSMIRGPADQEVRRSPPTKPPNRNRSPGERDSRRRSGSRDDRKRSRVDNEADRSNKRARRE
eukprot:TRINITY_DN1531_c0_g1_i2.p1 TRINITY_DN1531_c0_g1~~TRINITY_DN1531_c0_g1_i2.p1  ORF type:complete len:186 (+),score=25.39 TRINITY_DN1531_c0_g1_i2:487-1044(+)